MSDPRFLTAAEVADRLRTSPRAIVLACRAGKLRATKPGVAWLIPEDAIEEFLDRHSNQRSTSGAA